MLAFKRHKHVGLFDPLSVSIDIDLCWNMGRDILWHPMGLCCQVRL